VTFISSASGTQKRETLGIPNDLPFLFIYLFIFLYYDMIHENQLQQEIKNRTGLDNPKIKLKIKVCGINTCEDAGPLARSMDLTKPGSPVTLI
jgi:hypothetical protein